MIERRNILELIGKHRGKYHSCVLTCYSLDFSFFEERVLPVLKTANIKNINVFADGKFLEQAQENTSGREFRHNKTYSFHPIYSPGVFHPKIMLLTGVKHGLLIIGSGNITSAGLNSNDEIWGAFHLDSIENENAKLFSDAWEYLQSYLKQAAGFASQKFEWILKYSPWLHQLPTSASGFVPIKSLNQEIVFVNNSKTSSLRSNLLELIPAKNIETITVISPFYDRKGELISDIFNHYRPKQFNCIVDAEYGTPPVQLESRLLKEISFYDWKLCKSDFDQHYNRLHAKIFHFKYKDGEEIMFLGSGNATIAAFGSQSQAPLNDEAGIILKRNSRANLLSELGIKIPSISCDITKLQANNSSLLPGSYGKQASARIVYSELKGNELNLYLRKSTKADAFVKVLSNTSIELEKIKCSTEGEKLTVYSKNPDEIFKICLINDKGDNVSNYSIVHRLDYLLKSNPDPQQEKLDSLLEQDFSDGEGYTELLQYVDSNWADEETENIKAGGYRQNPTPKNGKDNTDSYKKLTAKEFNTVSNEILLKQAGELTSANVKIATFLGIVSSDAFSKVQFDITESEEQKLLEDIEQKGEGEEIPRSTKIKRNGQKEKRAISNYLKRLNDQYENKLRGLFQSRALTESPSEQINIKNLSSMLIALQLIQIYWGKRYTQETEISEMGEKLSREESYMKEGDIYSDCDTVKGFMIDALGKFLLLCTGKFKSYEYEILSQRLAHSRRQIFNKAVFITLNLSWPEKEIEYRDTLLLNLLRFINPDSSTDGNFIQDTRDQIQKICSTARHLHPSFDENLSHFTNKVLPKYCNWVKVFDSIDKKSEVITEAESIYQGNYIFSSKIGFNVVEKSFVKNDKVYFTLKRVGYEWNEDKIGCLLENVEYPKKCVIYN